MRGALLEVKKSVQSVSDDSNQGNAGFKLQPMEIFCGIFWPTLMFVYIFQMNLGWWRHSYWLETMVLAVVLPLLFALWHSFTMYQRVRQGTARRWKLVMSVVMWFVIFNACFQADKAYWRYAKSYYDFQNMASYINIDPSTDRGQTYMDGGEVYFSQGSRVEASKAIAFQEDEIYCVAPIVGQTMDGGADGAASLTGNDLKMPPSGTVDFWAVGINCCDPSGLNFKCGESGNRLARAGIRVLRDDIRPFFLMAVQEWTAWLRLPAKHPLFFHWVQDPLLQVDMFWFNAMKMFYVDTAKCIVGALAGTIIFQFLFYNLGFS